MSQLRLEFNQVNNHTEELTTTTGERIMTATGELTATTGELITTAERVAMTSAHAETARTSRDRTHNAPGLASRATAVRTIACPTSPPQAPYRGQFKRL